MLGLKIINVSKSPRWSWCRTISHFSHFNLHVAMPLTINMWAGANVGHTEAIHYSDVIMSAMVSQIAAVSIVYSTVCSGANKSKYQTSASLTFVRGIHRWPVNSRHKGPVTRKMFPFDDAIMNMYGGANVGRIEATEYGCRVFAHITGNYCVVLACAKMITVTAEVDLLTEKYTMNHMDTSRLQL